MKNRKWTQYVAMGVALLMAIVMLLAIDRSLTAV